MPWVWLWLFRRLVSVYEDFYPQKRHWGVVPQNVTNACDFPDERGPPAAASSVFLYFLKFSITGKQRDEIPL